MCSNHSITINNYLNNETVSHSYVLLKGTILTNFRSPCNSKFSNNNLCIRVENNYFTTQVYYNKFKTLVELKKGPNKIILTYCCYEIEHNLNFRPRKTNFCVVPLYIICKGDTGAFQAPLETANTPESASKRIQNGLKLIQTLISEKFYENHLLRKTFQLESDLTPNIPKVRLFHSNLGVSEARSMSQTSLWTHFASEILNSQIQNPNSKYIGFISCTRYRSDLYNPEIRTYSDILGITEAFVALGGGGLALFGTACLHTWPENIEDVFKYFLDTNFIDRTRFMDDSCYRGTIGGCFATTLGSVLHELCHTFDLGHTENGVMGRGFDNIDQEFIFENQKRSQIDNFSQKTIKSCQNCVKSDVSNKSMSCQTTDIKNTSQSCHQNIKSVSVNCQINVKSDIQNTSLSCQNTPVNCQTNVKSDIRNVSSTCQTCQTPDIKVTQRILKNSEKIKYTPLSLGLENSRKIPKTGIFWTPNCSILLYNHKWFNSYEETKNFILEFRNSKTQIFSSLGLKLVEIRENQSENLVQYFDFSNSKNLESIFNVPKNLEFFEKNYLIIAQDCQGNILKKNFLEPQ